MMVGSAMPARSVGDQGGIAQRSAVELGQAIGRGQQLGRRVVVAIPALIGCRRGQPKVGRQIDHPHAGSARAPGSGSRHTVRQAQEHQIDLAKRRVVWGDQRHVERAGVHVGQRLAGLRLGDRECDARLGVAAQPAQQLVAGVAGDAIDTNL
jgi:hypothetical protein